MARSTVRLNQRGVAALLKSPQMQASVTAAAEKIAANVRDQGIEVGDRDGGKYEIPLPVRVSHDTTDRVRSRVTLAHPAGQAVQAKHGALTKAAKQAGLDVKGS